MKARLIAPCRLAVAAAVVGGWAVVAPACDYRNPPTREDVPASPTAPVAEAPTPHTDANAAPTTPPSPPPGTDQGAGAAAGGTPRDLADATVAPAGAPRLAANPEVPPEPALKAAGEWHFLEVTGPVTVDGTTATLGSPIGPESTVATGPKGHAVLTLGAGSVVDVAGSTSFRIGKSSRKAVSLRMLAGALWSIMPHGASYEVMTANAVAGVRGTRFFVKMLRPNQTYVCACQGEVQVMSADRHIDNPLSSPHGEHNGVTLISRAEKQDARITKRRDHTDAQAAALDKFLPK